ncbi:ABC-2 type transport system permease protein [Agromyces flavus]|uniref:Transport permease protein n=1 Tax=Agromyces flavus TaxID=589382 RepID=A0A1H1U147_9MICO|nr:ABC transporter permease [Agromyces flavus]MCP2368319.1 ABC-2 type transport system permease protein [Agromyces flavus]GGI47780.1 transport permease protein [Agromyces flavus]SDS65629.1 ABC-2 type transport system permease protein [Agromyces flavus]
MTALAQQAPLRTRPRGLAAEAVFIRRSLTHTLRDTEALLMAVILPTMLMLLFTYVFGGALDPSGGYVDYVVPGIILLCAGFGASSTALYVARDMATGIIDRFRTMPLRAGAVLTGHVVASVLRNLFATGVVIVVALLVGFRPTAGPVEWLAAIGLIALYILAITSLFAAIGLAASSPEAANAYGFILLFLPYLSSAFVPVETLPDWLAAFAEHQPITPVIEAIRSLLMGTPMGDAAWWAVGWCVLFVVVAAVWGAWLFRRKAGRR